MTNDVDDSVRQRQGMPGWLSLKTIASVTTIIAAVGALLYGADLIRREIYKSALDMKQKDVEIERAKVDQERERKERIVAEKTKEIERLAMERAKEVEVKEAALARKEVATIEAENKIRLFDLEQKAKRETASESRSAREQEQRSTLIAALFVKDGDAIPVLAQLSDYSDRKHRRPIMMALAAKLDAPQSQAEVALVLHSLEAMSPEALELIIGANRVASRRWFAAFDQWKHAFAALDAQRYPLSMVQDREQRLLRAASELSDGGRAWFVTKSAPGRLVGYVPDVPRRAAAGTSMPPPDPGILAKNLRASANDMLINGTIIDHSKVGIVRLLPQTQAEFADLSFTDLIDARFLSGPHPRMDFKGVFLWGADFSRATLNSSSLRSIRQVTARLPPVDQPIFSEEQREQLKSLGEW